MSSQARTTIVDGLLFDGVSPLRAEAAISWYEFACAYVDMKWNQASAKYRKDIARALTAATPAMLAGGRGRPDDASIRRALVRWGFNTKQRADQPTEVAEVLAWVATNRTDHEDGPTPRS